jgi:hypothetical protein
MQIFLLAYQSQNRSVRRRFRQVASLDIQSPLPYFNLKKYLSLTRSMTKTFLIGVTNPEENGSQ